MDRVVSVKHVPYGSEEYQESLALRYRILREPLGQQFAPEVLENDKHSLHWIALHKEVVVGCAGLNHISSEEAKLRQFAVSHELQGKGIGKLLAAEIELYALTHGYLHITLSARETAVPFYQRLGYATEGIPFVEVTLPHIKMRKQIA